MTDWQKGSDALQHYHEQGQQAFDAAMQMGHYVRGNAPTPAPQDALLTSDPNDINYWIRFTYIWRIELPYDAIIIYRYILTWTILVRGAILY